MPRPIGRSTTTAAALSALVLLSACSNGGSQPSDGPLALGAPPDVVLNDRTFEAMIVASLSDLESRSGRVLTDLGFTPTSDTRVETADRIRFEATDGTRVVYVDLRTAGVGLTRMRIEAARVASVRNAELEYDTRLAREVAQRIASAGSSRIRPGR